MLPWDETRMVTVIFQIFLLTGNYCSQRKLWIDNMYKETLTVMFRQLVGCDAWCLIKWAFAGPNYQTEVSCNLYSSYDQRHNIDAVAKKVSLSLSLCSCALCTCTLMAMFCYSSQKTLPYFCFIMMVGQLNGTSLSGQNELFMSVL